MVSKDPEPRRSLVPGDIVGEKYRIAGLLGEGGMGQVFRAVHQHTGREVALKVIRPSLASSADFQGRFEAEARAIGALRHPNIVDVTDFGYSGDGEARFPYLVLELLDGFPLTQVLRPGSGLPWTWARPVLEQVCGAVAEAHRAGVVHGDLKPDNVWLRPRGDGGFEVKVLDFGLAHLRKKREEPSRVDGSQKETPLPETASPARPIDQRTTLVRTPASSPSSSDHENAIAGTPAYMSPERWRGGALSPRADIYSLGVLTYRMLTGTLPAPPGAQGAESVAVALRRLRPDIPTPAAEAVESALSEDMARRPGSARAFLEQLTRSPSPPPARPASAFLADLRYAVRSLRRSPLFASVAIVSLALGIGANTAIFTLLDQVLLRKLPVSHPEQLVMIYQDANNIGANVGSRMNSYPFFLDLQEKALPLADVLCRRLVSASITIGDQTERGEVEMASGSYFPMLGVDAAMGRVLGREDDQTKGGHPVVVLSFAYWGSRFARDPDVVGQKIRVNGFPMTIVGVSAKGFAGLDPAQAPQMWVPVQMKEAMMPALDWLNMEDRRAKWVQVFGRLKPGFTLRSAEPALQSLYTRIRAYEMTLPAATSWSSYSRQEFMRGRLVLAPGARGYSPLGHHFSTPLVVLMCMVALVLLIACANLANLLIARGLMRRKELAVRLSLGASRGRLVRQLLLESVVLAFAGAGVGLGIAFSMTRGLLALIPEQGQALLIAPEPDVRILVFTFGLALVTSLAFGLIPALRASGADPWTTLKATTGSIAGSGESLFLRKGLVAIQVALSFLLLFGAGLFVFSLQNLKAADTGVVLDNLVTFQIAPALSGYDDTRATLLYRSLRERLEGRAGVRSAASGRVPILAGDRWDNTVAVQDHEAEDGEDMQAYMNGVSPGYFETLQIPMIEGRDFTDADSKDPSVDGVAEVAIVNRAFAEHFFHGRSAIGKRLGWGGGVNARLTVEIVGVVADSLYDDPREGIRRQVYSPLWGKGDNAFYVRTLIPQAAAFDLVRQEVGGLDRTIPVFSMKTVSGQLDETLLTDRLVAMLAAAFGLVATLLASIGLYGLMAFVVTRRRKEMGIRLALGAQPQAVTRMVMREVFVLLGVGLAIGVPAALALGRLVASQLYGVQAYDASIALATMALLSLVSVAAGFIPAWSASRTNPIMVLRYE